MIYSRTKRTKTQKLHFRYYYATFPLLIFNSTLVKWSLIYMPVKSKCAFHYLTCLKIHGKYVCNGYLDLCLSQQHSTCRIFAFFDRECSKKKQHSISIKLNTYVIFLCLQYSLRGRGDRDRMVVGFTTTYAITQCLSPLMLWVPISISGRCSTLCDKVCQCLATDRWFSVGSPASSTNKTERHDKTEILLKVTLNTIKQTNSLRLWVTSLMKPMTTPWGGRHWHV